MNMTTHSKSLVFAVFDREDYFVIYLMDIKDTKRNFAYTIKKDSLDERTSSSLRSFKGTYELLSDNRGKDDLLDMYEYHVTT